MGDGRAPMPAFFYRGAAVGVRTLGTILCHHSRGCNALHPFVSVVATAPRRFRARCVKAPHTGRTPCHPCRESTAPSSIRRRRNSGGRPFVVRVIVRLSGRFLPRLAILLRICYSVAQQRCRTGALRPSQGGRNTGSEATKRVCTQALPHRRGRRHRPRLWRRHVCRANPYFRHIILAAAVSPHCRASRKGP